MKSSCYLNVDPSPPVSASRPPDVIHVIDVPRPSPFFAALLLPCIIWNENRRTKLGRPENETNYCGCRRLLHAFEHSPTTIITVDVLPLIP